MTLRSLHVGNAPWLPDGDDQWLNCTCMPHSPRAIPKRALEARSPCLRRTALAPAAPSVAGQAQPEVGAVPALPPSPPPPPPGASRPASPPESTAVALASDTGDEHDTLPASGGLELWLGDMESSPRDVRRLTVDLFLEVASHWTLFKTALQTVQPKKRMPMLQSLCANDKGHAHYSPSHFIAVALPDGDWGITASLHLSLLEQRPEPTFVESLWSMLALAANFTGHLKSYSAHVESLLTDYRQRGDCFFLSSLAIEPRLRERLADNVLESCVAAVSLRAPNSTLVFVTHLEADVAAAQRCGFTVRSSSHSAGEHVPELKTWLLECNVGFHSKHCKALKARDELIELMLLTSSVLKQCRSSGVSEGQPPRSPSPAGWEGGTATPALNELDDACLPTHEARKWFPLCRKEGLTEVRHVLKELVDFVVDVTGKDPSQVPAGETFDGDQTIYQSSSEFVQRGVILLSLLEKTVTECCWQQVEQLVQRAGVREALKAPRTKPEIVVGTEVLAPQPNLPQDALYLARISAFNSKTVALEFADLPPADQPEPPGWVKTWAKCSRRVLRCADTSVRDDVEVIAGLLHQLKRKLGSFHELEPWTEVRQCRAEMLAQIGPLLQETGKLSPSEVSLLQAPPTPPQVPSLIPTASTDTSTSSSPLACLGAAGDWVA